MFGAWQAGAWRALATHVRPDMVVGASVGSLNGWAIAGGATPEQLIEAWRNPQFGDLNSLPATVRGLLEQFPLKMDYSVVLTDTLRMKPVIYSNAAVTWQHLVASCAVPLVLPQIRIDGRWYSDGGLLNPLPVWAAVELGATDVIAIHPIWPRPAFLMKPVVYGFVRIFGHHPQVPEGVRLATLGTPPLGSLRDALYWNKDNVGRWIEAGYAAGSEFATKHFS